MSNLSADKLLKNIVDSGLVDEKKFQEWSVRQAGNPLIDPYKICSSLIAEGLLTKFQAKHLCGGKFKGFLINEKYKILDLLGSGGMGKVFLCEHTGLGIQVALKILPGRELSNQDSLQRFYREARAFAVLNHPNLVRGFDVDSDGKLHYIVMEYVKGITLQELLRQKGPVDYRFACNIIGQVCSGLQHAHEKGWVHRDIKPSNLIVDSAGMVKILDLGLARLLSEENIQSTKNLNSNCILGTADYMSPEQAIDTRSADIRSDIYSLGCTMYAMLVGNPPFADGSVNQKIIWHQVRSIPSVREFRKDIPEKIANIVRKMTSKNPVDRYQTPREIIEEFEQLKMQEISGFSDFEVNLPKIASLPNDPDKLGSDLVVAKQNRYSSEFTIGSKNTGRMEFEKNESKDTVELLKGNNTRKGSSTKNQDRDRLELISENEIIINSDAKSESISSMIATRIGEMSKKIHKGLKLKVGKKIFFACLIATGIISISIFCRLVNHDPYRDLMRQFSETELILKDSEEGPVRIVSLRSQRVKVIYLTEEGKIARENEVETVKTIAEAVSFAKDGTRIYVLGQTIREDIEIDGDSVMVPKRISLIAKGSSGTLSLSSSAEATKPNVSLKSVQGWSLQGFYFQSDNTRSIGLKIQGNCPGLRIENCTFSEYSVSSIIFENASGEPDESMKLVRLKWIGNKKDVENLVRIDADNSVGASRHLSFQNCEFCGLAKVAILLKGSASFIEFRRNRFYNVSDVFRFECQENRSAIEHLRINCSANTIASSGAVFRFSGLPLLSNLKENRLIIKNNLIYKVPRIFWVDQSVDSREIRRLFPGFEGNVQDPDSGDEGNMILRLRQEKFELSTDPNDPRFLLYPPTSPLAQIGPGKSPVGVPPF